MDFREYIRTKILEPDQRILEFGPLTRPTVTRETHPKVSYADVRSTEDIKKLYSSNDYLASTGIKVDLNSIVNIDYVINGTYKESFKNVEKFDVVLLSHVIEHMPDIITFFEDIINVINKNGKLIIIYPDARYCFDHFRNGTSFIDAYEVYKYKSSSSNRVLDFVFNVVKENNPSFFWGGENTTRILPKNDFNISLKAYSKALKNELPDDTHFWPFADYQFVKFLYDLERANLLNFQIDNFCPTQENTQEFMVVLTPKSVNTININNYARILRVINPITKEAQLRNKSIALSKKLDGVILENERLKNEINEIKSSKKWKYVNNLATVIKRLHFKYDKK